MGTDYYDFLPALCAYIVHGITTIDDHGQDIIIVLVPIEKRPSRATHRDGCAHLAPNIHLLRREIIESHSSS